MNSWSKGRVLGLCGVIAVYGLAILLIAFACDKVGRFIWLGMLGYTTFVLAAIALFKPPKNLMIAILLAGVISAAPIYRARALFAECAIALVVMGVGVVCYVGLKKMCKNLPPTEAPPPPPLPSCTNCNPSHPAWPCTNCPPLKSIGLKSLVWNDGSSVVVNLPDDAIFVGQITNQLAEVDPYGNPYTRVFWFSLNTSENLLDWSTSMSVTGWVSQSAMVAVTYNANGTPLGTNWSQIVNAATTNTITGNMRRREQQFFLVK